MKTKFALLLPLCFATVAAADWPAFLGGASRSDAVSFSPPTTWSATKGVRWQVPLVGHGQSSPIVIGDHVYVTAIDGPMKERNLVSCFDLGSGQQRWQHVSESSLQVKNDVYTSRAAPTPVADAGGVYAFFESGNLIAFDPEGQVRWSRDLLKDYGKYEGRFGLGGSLAQTEDRIFVLADNEGPAYVLALDKVTGETIWKTDRESRTAWSSPMIVPVDGKPQLVVSATGTIDGYAVDSGEQLWSFDEVGGNTVATPIVVGDSQFLIGASPGRNGESSEGSRRSNGLYEINAVDGKFSLTQVWRNEKANSSFGSPVAHSGHAYYANRAGVVYCLDLQTGEAKFTARLADSNWATPIGIGKHVYFFGRGGETTVLEIGPTENIVATNKLWKPEGDGGPGGFNGEIQYGVAAIPDGFIIRTGTKLFRIGE
ncbi:MAG: PQQ-binding-like beta-propeller repeat protein [Planctomycetota bacterium]